MLNCVTGGIQGLGAADSDYGDWVTACPGSRDRFACSRERPQSKLYPCPFCEQHLPWRWQGSHVMRDPMGWYPVPHQAICVNCHGTARLVVVGREETAYYVLCSDCERRSRQAGREASV